MAKIYASTSSVINCEYTLSIARSGSDIIITASGTIYGNGSSQNDSSDLYVHLCYGVSPANTTGTGAPTNRGTRFGDGQKIVTRPLNKNSIPKSGLTFNVSWTITDNAARTFSNCALFLSGSATNQGLAGGAKSYMFIGERLSTNISNQIRYYTETLSITAGYSNVSNPTASSIKFNSSSTTPLVVTPNASITVSWAAGTAGTNNAIKQYEVTLNGTTRTTTNTYYDFSNLNLGRGTSYSAIVKAIPTIPGYGPSSGETSTNKVKGNTLPTAPTITLSGTTILNNVNYIKSNGTATFSLSSSDADGHTITYYRNTTNSTSGATAITGTSWSTSTGGTYYFWAKDSLGEYSSVSSKSFTKNVKPSADGKNLTLTRTSQYTSNQITNWLKDYYYTAGKATITGVTSTCGVASYTWNIRTYDYSGGSTTPTFNTVAKDYTSTTTTTNSCSYSYPTNGDWGKAYKIRCIITDKLGEQSEIISEGYCVIPPAPSLDSDIWNTLNLSDVTGSLHKSFYQYMSTKVNYVDSSVTVEPTISGNAQVRLNDTTSFSSSGKIPLVISNTAQWTTYTLTLSLKSAWRGTSVFNSKTYNITRTGAPKVLEGSTRRVFNEYDIIFDGSTEIKPFTDATNFNISFKNYISGNNFSGNGENANIYLSANGKMVAIVEANRETSQGFTTITTKRGGPYATSGLYNWSTNELGLYLRSGNESVGFCIEFTDVFGISYYYTKWGLTFNFSETPDLKLSMGGATYINTKGYIIKEKDSLIYQIGTENEKAKTYSTSDITFTPQIYRSDITMTKSALKNLTDNDWKDYGSTFKQKNLSRTTNSAIEFYINQSFEVGQIDNSQYCYFRIKATQDGKTIPIIAENVEYISQRHCALTSLDFDQQQPTYDLTNKTFGYSFTLPTLNGKTDYGAGIISENNYYYNITNAYYGIQFSTTSNFSSTTTKWLTSEGGLSSNQVSLGNITNGTAQYSGSNIDLSGLSTWQFYNIRIVYWSKIGNDNTKTTYGKTFLLYNSQPTVSYRQNQVGININGIETNHINSAVVIGSTSGKNLIKLISANKTATINLDTGALDGFVFDGGDNWGQS